MSRHKMQPQITWTPCYTCGRSYDSRLPVCPHVTAADALAKQQQPEAAPEAQESPIIRHEIIDLKMIDGRWVYTVVGIRADGTRGEPFIACREQRP